MYCVTRVCVCFGDIFYLTNSRKKKEMKEIPEGFLVTDINVTVKDVIGARAV